MARLVGAFGVSHGPMLTTPPDKWELRATFDRGFTRHAYRGKYYDFPSLLRERAPGFQDQLSLETKTKRHAAAQAAVAEVARRYTECGANAAIILGNDQREIFKDTFTPALLIYAGNQIPNIYPDDEEEERLERLGLAIALPGHVPVSGATYPGAPQLAELVVDRLIESEFDVAISYGVPSLNGRVRGIPHAFGFIFRRIMNDAPPPTVPVFMNVGETRNQPRLQRLLNFGHAIKQAIDKLPDDLDIAIFASGGFSHFTIDEEFDRAILAAMQQGDETALLKFPESWFLGNTCETKSWYPMVAAMNDLGRRMDLIDYIPCYRSEAGTGQGMVFASWI